MDKQELLVFIKEKIAPNFHADGKYGNIENSDRIYNILINLSENVDYERILIYLNALKNTEKIDDLDVDYAIEAAMSNKSNEEQLKLLKEEKQNKGYYDATDVALVRVTEHFPVNKVVPAICNVPFVCKINSDIKGAMFSILKENDSVLKEINEQLSLVTAYSDEQYKLLQKREGRIDELLSIAMELSPYSTQYRSSVHFCLNGVVSNHSKGTFDGKFVIIEPFVAHENDSNILAVRPEDTYFEEQIILSDKATILVEENARESLSVIPNIEDYNIVFYKGNRDLAVNKVLVQMGIVPEKVEEHNIKLSETSRFLGDFITKKDYCNEKHVYAESYRADDLKNIQLWPMYEQEFYSYLLMFIKDENIKNTLQNIMLSESMMFNKEDLIKEIIVQIGMEEFKKITNEFNQKILSQIAEGNYPTNKELISGERTLDIVDKDNLKL